MVEEFKVAIPDGDFWTQCLFQPLPAIFGQRSAETGGNAMARTPEQETFAYPRIKTWIQTAKGFAATIENGISTGRTWIMRIRVRLQWSATTWEMSISWNKWRRGIILSRLSKTCAQAGSSSHRSMFDKADKRWRKKTKLQRERHIICVLSGMVISTIHILINRLWNSHANIKNNQRWYKLK